MSDPLGIPYNNKVELIARILSERRNIRDNIYPCLVEAVEIVDTYGADIFALAMNRACEVTA